MTIECYYSACEHHECNDDSPDAGPFCHKTECVATAEQAEGFELIRRRQLAMADLKRARDEVQRCIAVLLDTTV